MRKCCLFVLVFLAVSVAYSARAQAPSLLLNEIDADPPSPKPNVPFEFVELKGVANSVITNVYFVSIEGDVTANRGVADLVTPINGVQVGSNGLIIIKSTGNAGFSPATGTRVIEEPDLDAGNGIENGTNSFLLIYSPTTAIVEGNDYDANDDGVLELLLANAVLLDAIAFNDDNAGDITYGGVVLSVGSNPPAAAVRFPNNNSPLNAGAFYYGKLSGEDNSTTFTSNPANRSANFPAGGALSPGDLNGPNNIALPVVISKFLATRKNSVVTLQWETTLEVANSGFAIERKTNGNFESISFVTSKARGGNSNTTLSYSYSDANTFNGTSLYRLKQTDADGRFQYSTIRQVNGTQATARTMVYPNPSETGSVTVTFGSESIRRIQLVDANGKTLQAWPAYRDLDLKINMLTKGIYYLRSTTVSTGEREVQRIVIRQ